MDSVLDPDDRRRRQRSRVREGTDPAATAVRRAQPVAALPVATVNEDEWIRMSDAARDPVLDEHLSTVDDGTAREPGALEPVPVVAPVGDIENRRDRGRLTAQWDGCRGNR